MLLFIKWMFKHPWLFVFGITAVQTMIICNLKANYQKHILELNILEKKCSYLKGQVHLSYLQEDFEEKLSKANKQLQDYLFKEYFIFLNRDLEKNEAEFAIHLQSYVKNCRENSLQSKVKINESFKNYYFGVEKYFLNARQEPLSSAVEELFFLEKVLAICLKARPLELENVEINSIDSLLKKRYELKLAFIGHAQTLRLFLNDLAHSGLPVYIKSLEISNLKNPNKNFEQDLRKLSVALSYNPSFLECFNVDQLERIHL